MAAVEPRAAMSSECNDAAAINVDDNAAAPPARNRRDRSSRRAARRIDELCTRCATAAGSCSAANGSGTRLAITIHVSAPL